MSPPTPPRVPRHRADSSAGWAGDQRRVTDFVGLLTAMGCETAAELDLMLYAAFELDPCITEVGLRHVVVTTRDRGTEVTFPCTLSEFWDAVSRLEDEARERLEDTPDE